MSRGKEILLQEDDRFLIKIGTIDNRNPKSIFLTISSWTKPKREEENYERVVLDSLYRAKRPPVFLTSSILILYFASRPLFR